VIGDVFSMAGSRASPDEGSGSPFDIEETLLRHLLETLLNSPQVDRVESQLLLHSSGSHAEIFRKNGFDLYRRLFMVQKLDGFGGVPRVNLPKELELRPWRDEDLVPAGRLISLAYANHPDSLINDQYRSVHGSQRFLHNIVRYSGCGAFSAPCSHVIVERASREMVALVLGSRVSPESGHITQVCVHPHYRRHGLARALLSLAAFHFLRLGAAEISLTVTEANTEAVELYRAEGYEIAHTFDGAVWERGAVA
jgi:ribosomal protein S18 acetylase RimI-like enzyme